MIIDNFVPPHTFIDDFVDNYWEKKPGVFRSLFPEGLISPPELLAIISKYREISDAAVFGLSKDGEMLSRNEREIFAECTSHPDFSSFVEATLSRHAADVFFGYFSNLQQVPSNLWLKFRPLMNTLANRVGLPGNRVDLDLFMGKYPASPSGIHKDSASLCFITEGRKRILVWPYETFTDLPGVRADDPYSQTSYFLGDRATLDDWRESAIVLEGGPGDVLYWPSHYWHIGVDADDISVMVTLAFFLPDNIAVPLERAYERTFLRNRRLYSTHTRPFGFDPENSCFSAIDSPEKSALQLNRDIQAVFQDELKSLTRSWSLKSSMFGFDLPPEFPTLPSLEAKQYRISDHGQAAVFDNGSSYEVHATGHTFHIEFLHDELRTILKRINSKAPFALQDFGITNTAQDKELLELLEFLRRRRVIEPSC